MLNTIAYVLFGGVFILLAKLYFRSVNERNHLGIYAGTLLLVDSVRQDHKLKLDNWIRANPKIDAAPLSSHAVNAIARMAETLAAGDAQTGRGSLVLGFHVIIWDRKRELQDDSSR
jgi:hypothetical protein